VEKAFTVTINSNSTVSVLVAPSAPAQSYIAIFQVFTNDLNAELRTGVNPYNTFNLAPTTSDYAVQYVPVHVLPLDPRNTSKL